MQNGSTIPIFMENTIARAKVFHRKGGWHEDRRCEHFSSAGGLLEIGFTLIPSERGKGYGTEAVQILVDYLFLSRDLVRIQAFTELGNMASQRLLDKVGFKREGTIRKSMFIRGEWRDLLLYSILREEWREPSILTSGPSKK